ncbi:alpha-tocopherol transfer protein-like isoform X4 [Neodiprion virginianus]|uniref:alpha-tocopherol transfer protein-like isoform X4 n=1 Tax=Neodiprion virginianus TaxID=2961670 RepID=UPI001EE6A55D|nr:alpha-tocopherol transfer protein-like isoform X4 [Neodiprion virginianus]XP_046608749.1 alpha-tocopherol transfer protein-like isoform X4 [Neodiprion virginianus]XP_046608750.1 alpha-tocopherol transfer protein-like isoform X4 [Neodiprion virginianus]
MAYSGQQDEPGKGKAETGHVLHDPTPGAGAIHEQRSTRFWSNRLARCNKEIIACCRRYVILPKLTPENCRTCILQPTVNDVNKFDPWLLHKYMFMVGDIRMVEDRSVGDIFVYDLAMISLGHVMKLTPTLLKKCEVAASEAYATRIRGIHFINAPPFVDRIVTMVKSVLKPKLAARMHVHAVGDLESFHRLVPKSILPKDYGGSYSTMKEISDLLRKKVDDWRDWFLEQEKVFADERLRPGPAFDENDLFGFSGSFRKLAVD